MTRDHMIRVLLAGIHGPDRARCADQFARLAPAALRLRVSNRLRSLALRKTRPQYRAPATTYTGR